MGRGRRTPTAPRSRSALRLAAASDDDGHHRQRRRPAGAEAGLREALAVGAVAAMRVDAPPDLESAAVAAALAGVSAARRGSCAATPRATAAAGRCRPSSPPSSARPGPRAGRGARPARRRCGWSAASTADAASCSPSPRRRCCRSRVRRARLRRASLRAELAARAARHVEVVAGPPGPLDHAELVTPYRRAPSPSRPRAPPACRGSELGDARRPRSGHARPRVAGGPSPPSPSGGARAPPADGSREGADRLHNSLTRHGQLPSGPGAAGPLAHFEHRRRAADGVSGRRSAIDAALHRLVRTARSAPADGHRHDRRRGDRRRPRRSARRCDRRAVTGGRCQRRARRVPRDAVDRHRRHRGASMVELARSADWSGGVVFVNGHGGNVDAVDRALTTLDRDGRPASPGGRASRAATPTPGEPRRRCCSPCAPTSSASTRVAGETAPPVRHRGPLRTARRRAVAPNGVLGDPAGATAEEGRTLLDRLVDDLTRAVDTWPLA